MKKYILMPLLLIIMFSGCAPFNMKFQPTAELKEQYDSSSKTRDVAVYYTVKTTANSKVLQMAIHNTASVYMKNLTVNYDNCCQTYSKGAGKYNFNNLGNLKNRSYKTMTLNLAKETRGTIKLGYSYTPVKEDNFLNNNSTYTPVETQEAVDGFITLYIGN